MAQVSAPNRVDPVLGTTVNDIHSGLNRTDVARAVSVHSVEDIRRRLWSARHEGLKVCIAGGRHAMGGQQFAEGALLLDTREFNRVLAFNRHSGLLEVEAGIQWPELMDWLLTAQVGDEAAWGIAQKQTGADRLSIGGALAANVHGRGLTMRPFIDNVESFTIVDASGRVLTCSRDRNAELFRLAIGGYGLFGVIATVTLRLVRRQKVERVVELLDLPDVMDAFERRIGDGHLYGDFQYATAEASDDFMSRGVLSSYRPVPESTDIPEGQHVLSEEDWSRLLHLAHVDKQKAFDIYSSHYLTTSGQVYWSDSHQRSVYLDDYHSALDQSLGCSNRGSEVISEIYVRREDLVSFMAEAREDFRRHGVNVIYGTIRLIEQDDESFLAWAREPWACIIFNLHTEHTPQGIEHTEQAFRRLIAMAARRGGSYYLTYGRYATRTQVEACHPRFKRFLVLKRTYDPDGIFQSEWYRHYRRIFYR